MSYPDFKHSLYAVQVGAGLLGSITQCRVQPGTKTAGEPASGQVVSVRQSITAQQPGATWRTLDIASALGLITSKGVSIAALNGGLRCYLQRVADGGTRMIGNNHVRYTMVKGLIVPRQLSASHQADAQLDCEAFATWDGDNDPVSKTDLVALPGGLVEVQALTLGPITIGGLVLTGVRSLNIDFGIQVQTEGWDSCIWPIHASVKTWQPTITIRCVNPHLLRGTGGPSTTAIPLTGGMTTHLNTAIFLRRRYQGSTYYPDADAAHVKLTVNGLCHVDNLADANGQESAETSVTIATVFDGTNDPILCSANVAIA